MTEEPQIEIYQGGSMRKRIAFIMVTASVLLITGCGASNSAEEPVEADSQIMENVEQRDTEENTASENTDDAAESGETQEPAEEEDWEDKALLEEYAACGIEEDDGFYYYQGELVYIIKDQSPDSSVYLLNTDSKGTVSIKVIRNAEGEITSVTYMTEEEVAKALPRILGRANEERDTNTDVLSPLEGVTMEVIECSDTSVTVRIANDTDKDIQCGADFCLKMQDEETGEWRELDTVIDNAAFTSEAYMIQKDSPYEKVINFEWLYGKLEPGRYRIVKTVMDFRGTGDHTNYAYTAEFRI